MSKLLYPEKHQTPALFDAIASTYDRINAVLSLGIDRYWRRQLMRHLPQRSSLRILDLATGTGDVPLALVRASNVAYVEGIDMSKGMIDLGRKKVAISGLQGRIDLQVGDGVNIPKEDQKFDAVTISFGIRNFYAPLESLENCWRVLKPGGRLLVLEFSIPTLWPIKVGYLFYFRYILPALGRLLSGHDDAYQYLNRSVEDFPYGKEFELLMNKAGFKQVRSIPMTGGIATLYLGEKE